MAIIHETDDAPWGVDTPYTMEPGDTFRGTISSNYFSGLPDIDYIRIELNAGATYEITLAGRENGGSPFAQPLADPELFLYDSNGDFVVWHNDIDFPDNRNSFIEFTLETSGTYHIGVAGGLINSYDVSEGVIAGTSSTGDYELRVSEIADTEPHVATYDEIAYQLSHGFSGGFPAAFQVSGNTLDVDLSGLTTEGQQLARWALEAWSNVTGINFRFGTSYNPLTWSYDAHITFVDHEEGAFATIVSVASASGVGGRIISAEVNVSADWLAEHGTTMDTPSFQAYIHEIGHALGLGHPGDYADEGTYGVDNEFLNDSWQATVMSYFSQTDNTHIDADYAFDVTPMIADIIAIQNLYGVPAGINSGDTVYGSNSNAGGYLGELFTLMSGERRDPDLYGGDAVTLTLYDTGGIDTLDLRTDPRNQRVDLRPEGISDVLGLRGNLSIARDTVIENFIAGSGDDRVTGNAAANRLEGRIGNDTLAGGDGNDTLVGGSGNDTLTGDAGDDMLAGGAGGDRLGGGAGRDTLDYRASSAGVTVDLASGTVSGGHARGDTIGGFENVAGSAHHDRITGNGTDNELTGGAGNDTLIGDPGNDRLDGGRGNDVLTGGAGNDTLIGGPGQDTLSGGRGRDRLDGGRGNDTLTGDAGDDVLSGGAGSDRLEGGAGSDRLDDGPGQDTLSGGTGNDTLTGGRGNDTLIGGPGRDALSGGRGGDRLEGERGNDTLTGGAGNDILIGGGGRDRLIGGMGDDIFFFGSGNGNDTIVDFTEGHDLVDLTSFGLAGFSDLNVSAGTTGVTIDLSGHGGGSILLQGSNIADLDASDFLL